MTNNKNIFSDKQFILTIGLILFLSVFLLFNYNNFSSSDKTTDKYTIKIIEISANCENCFDVGMLKNPLVANTSIKIKSNEILNYKSIEAKKLIEKYDIKTIPALIILSNNIEKIEFDGNLFRLGNKYAIFDKSVPYLDLYTNKINGLIQLKKIQSNNCEECSNVSRLKTQIENLGVKIDNYEIINSSTDLGKELIKNNSLEFTPALLISKNIEKYWWIFPQLKPYIIEKEDSYLFSPIPPYMSLKEKKIKGIVDITFIRNDSCEDCFNVSELKKSFENFGIYLKNENMIDIKTPEGKLILKKYNITAIPTVILSKGISDYGNLNSTLSQGGTFEKGGEFIFRNLDLLNVKYQKLI